MMIWLLLTLSALSLAQENAVEEYCFSSPIRRQEVATKLQFILVPVDKLQPDKNCFTISTPGHRRELIQNYVRRIEPAVSIAFSSAELRREHCQLKVEKVKNLEQTTLSGDVQTDKSISVGTEQSKRAAVEFSTIKTMKEFELKVNQDSIKGECRFITPIRYEITISVLKEARPILPPLPEGTVVVVPDAKIPPPQETAALTTTVQLNQGERLELGSIVKNLTNSAHQVDLKTGAAGQQTSGQETEKIFLSIE